MERVTSIIKNKAILKDATFIIGSICGAMSIIFYALWQDTADRLGANNYDIHMPFGYLLLFLVAATFIVAVVLTISVLDRLDNVNETSYFTPITRTIIILILLILVFSIEIIADTLYQMIRIFNPAVGP